MAETEVARHEHDALDDLFAYDATMDDVFNTNASNNGPAQSDRGRLDTNKTDNGGLGIDEEVTVIKKRAPVAKLDETR